MKKCSRLEEALNLTRSVFRESEKSPALSGSQNILYAAYGLFHRQIAIPLKLFGESGSIPPKFRRAVRFRAEIEGKVVPMDWRAELKAFGEKLRRLGWQLLPFIYSMVSLAYFILNRKRRTGIWTGDFYDEATQADFRLGGLLVRLKHSDIHFVELIRTNNNGFLAFWRNAKARRRPALYYESMVAYLGWVFPSADLGGGSRKISLVKKIFSVDLNRIAKTIPLFSLVLKGICVKELIAWEYSDRQAGLIHAARTNGIPVVGFMHGAGMETYMAHEFIGEYPGPDPLGPDYFGVWSDWWKGYFEGRSRLYGRIEVSGSLRKTVHPHSYPSTQGPIRRILWISEPLADVEDILPYLRAAAGHYQVVLKKRPSTSDVFYNKLLETNPDLQKLETLDGDIFKAIAECDAVVGSHSTAVLDASVIGKPFVLVDTRKWGDYFEMGGGVEGDILFANTPGRLLEALSRWESCEAKRILSGVARRFYGETDKDGCAWVTQKILSLREHADNRPRSMKAATIDSFQEVKG